MILNNVELIETDIGKIPVIINEVVKNGNVIYQGKSLYSEINILIETPTKESCMIGMCNAFDLYITLWLENQLMSIKTDF